MGNEYDATLEEEIESLEGENEVLGLEVERLTEKLDGLEARFEAKHKAVFDRKMQMVASELMKELGVTKCSTDDPEIIIAMCRKKINEMRWNQPTEIAPLKGVVRIMLKQRSPVHMDYFNDMYMTKPYDRFNEPMDMRYQHYQLTVDELVKDHGNMMEAIAYLSEALARTQYSHEMQTRGRAEDILEQMCKRFNLKVLPHNKG